MKSRNSINKKPITALLIGLGFLSVILLATMIAASQNTNYNNPGNGSKDKSDNVDGTMGGSTLLCVVKGVDLTNRWITLLDIKSGVELVLSYHGGTDIKDQYNKVISANQLPLGVMVDINYQGDNNKLLKLNISQKAWRFVGAKRVNINLQDQVMEIAADKFKYNNNLTVLEGENFISPDKLAKQDELTIWGYDQTVWSVIVTKGHGTVKLENYKEYLDKQIKVGYEPLQKIEQGLEIIVREGECNLTVENGAYSATKSIMVKRNQVTYVSLNDLGPIGPKTGLVLFQLTPYGADLYVDGKSVSYEDVVKLEYGKHTVKASLGGYNTYEGTIHVDSDQKMLKIKLPQNTSNEKPTATEGDTPTTSITPTLTPTLTPQDSDKVDSERKIYVQTPVQASVYFDGSFIGIAPCSYKKVIGSHVLTFLKDGYQTKSYTVDIKDDKVDAYFNYPELTKSD